MIQASFPDLEIKAQHQLSDVTYFKLGGPADFYLELADIDQLPPLLSYCHQHHIPVTFLGGASNLIVDDAGIKGLVIKLINAEFEVISKLEDGRTIIKVGAGLKTALLTRKSVDSGLAGLEYFLGVPGNVGGAIYNNAHYLDHLIGEYVHRVRVMDQAGQDKWLTAEECQFGYDKSRFQTTHEVIIEVEFALPAGDKETSMELIKKSTQYRAQTQPLGEASSGCIFQNTPNTPQLKKIFPQFADQKFVPGGFLIDQAGLKGEKVGDIEVSHKHAAFFVNKGQGSSADVKTLIDKVKQQVHQKFGVELQEEVFYVK